MTTKDFDFNSFDDGTYFGTTGDCEIPEDWYVCYGRFTKECPRRVLTQNFKIRLWKLNSKVMTEDGHNNVCLYNKKEIENHLKEIQKVHKFDYTIICKRNYYIIDINIVAHALYIKVVLTWVRLLYEFPYNVLYREALQLQKMKEFSNMNLLSIYNFVCSTMDRQASVGYESGFIYSSRFTEPITYKELKNRINTQIAQDKYWVNWLFTITTNEGPCLMPDMYYDYYSKKLYDIIYSNIPLNEVEDEYKEYYGKGYNVTVLGDEVPKEVFKRPYDNGEDWSYYSFWTSKEHFKKRLEAYLYNLRILNEYLKNKK